MLLKYLRYSSLYLPEIYQEMAYVYNKKGDIDKALWCLDMTDHINCDHIHMKVMRGHIFLSNGKTEEARKSFDKALELANNSAIVQLKIAISYHDHLHLQYAHELYLKYFRSIEKDCKEGYSYMALCCKELKKDDEYLYYLKKACEENPEEAKIVLSEFFPEDLEPKDYLNYALEHLND